MYFTARGKDQRIQKVMDFSTAQKLLEISCSHQKLETFFEQFDIQRIVIVPYNHFGKCLVRMLDNKDIDIKCFADKMCDKFVLKDYLGIPIKNYSDLKNEDIDAVVVASNFYFNDIVDSLLENNIFLEKIIGINTILYGMERMK